MSAKNNFKIIFYKLKANIILGTLFIILFNNNVFASSEFAAKNYDLFQLDRNTEILSTLPTRGGTVGTVLVYIQNEVPYILLARERIDGLDEKKAGTFSDFGGRTEGMLNSFAVQTLRELQEETVDSFKLTMEDLLTKSYVIYLNKKNRDVIYSIYLVSEDEFTLSRSLNDIRQKAIFNPQIPYSKLEKDLFLWLPVKELLETKNIEEFDISDINHQIHHIKLRKFFIDDCLHNENFAKIISTIVLNYLTFYPVSFSNNSQSSSVPSISSPY